MIIDEIETLHNIARCVSVAIPAAEYGNEMLHEVIERIACQLDREKSIWQKIADERYPAWEWVESHGGLESLKARLMPEGMEWPRYEDGEPVRIGDEYECWCGDTKVVSSVTLREGRSVINESQMHSFVVSDGPFTAHGERVKRPAPKVLDSEGVECNVGDAVWWVHNKTGNFRIIRIEKDGKCAIHDDEADEPCGMTVPSTELTHKRPVLDADGKPLREGETVYLTYSPTAFVVDDIMTREDGATVVHLKDGAWNLPQYLTHQRPVLDADGVPINVGDTVWYRGHIAQLEVRSVSIDVNGFVYVTAYNDYEGKVSAPAEFFTHTKPEPPDSWERLKADIYREIETDKGMRLASEFVEAIVRRCKALAGVSE